MNRTKIFILGIDGATFDVISPLIERGKLPNMQRVIDNGVHGILHSTTPSLSAAAWVAFMTGKNSGHYGTYHFRKIDINEYQDIYSQDLISSSAYSGTTFFDYLSKIGYRVGVMAIPVTYPPWPVNGFMVSGYPCPDPDENPNFAFPPELSHKLSESLNWTEKGNPNIIHKNEMRGARDPQDVLNGGLAMMSRRTSYTLKLMKKFDCDATILVWGAIDRAQHMLWKYYDPRHILHQPGNNFKSFIERLYCHGDHLLGKIMGNIGRETRIIIVSDHGFGPKQGSYFHLNAWLNKHGYLKTTLKSKLFNNFIIEALKGPLRKFVINRNVSTRRKMIKASRILSIGNIDFNNTRAYWFPIDEQTEGVVINLKGRQQSGCVTKEEYEPLRTELIERLLELRDSGNGRRVIKKAFKREELYSGDKCLKAPDIIIVLQEGYYPGSKNSKTIFSGMPRVHMDIISGNHRPEGIFMACGPDISQGKLEENATIMDVAPTVLYALREKIPQNMEGKVLNSVFSTERLKIPPEYVDYELSRQPVAGDLSSVEQESIRKKLKDLGYL